MTISKTILNELNYERMRQDLLHGKDSMHTPFVWLSIILEELGEASRAAMQGSSWREGTVQVGDFRGSAYREELIHTAASCIAAIECLDRVKS